jgi:uncharacterized protein YyaL (SSP411 family)
LFTTGSYAQPLVTRPKDLLDNATPSANSSAANALIRLAALTGDMGYHDRADVILRLLGEPAARHPLAFGHLLAAVDLTAHGAIEVAVAGDRSDLVSVVTTAYRPDVVLAWGERYSSPIWDGRDDGQAYVCRDFTCRVPVSDPDALAAQLVDV